MYLGGGGLLCYRLFGFRCDDRCLFVEFDRTRGTWKFVSRFNLLRMMKVGGLDETRRRRCSSDCSDCDDATKMPDSKTVKQVM